MNSMEEIDKIKKAEPLECRANGVPCVHLS